LRTVEGDVHASVMTTAITNAAARPIMALIHRTCDMRSPVSGDGSAPS
jgi:hypothetical protein